ncbi:MAG: hypothetical protein UV23_C0002G0002 [Candidatus Nomurabacteria bacterium GW2011_GWF1_42_40]|nr:MAG: hypothetical protein UV23_C0002G0002 [Candidatus Nomurabacteria bacterium GW2011_GWF1_42_40]
MQIEKLPREKFPKALLEIPQPSRKFTSYGREACEKIIAGLKGYPIVIVSGLAMGIDAIAHRKALSVGLKTLIFPGSGLGKEAMYPKTNLRLAEELIESGSCLISEFAPDFKATLWSFPMRNRLMAGISKATLIIEAAEKSGTLITARLATEYNRDVLAVPGPIFSPNSKGTNKLLRQGATPVTSAEEVLEALGFEMEKDEKKQAKLFLDLSPEEKTVVNLLREPVPRDDLIRAMKMPVPTANALLSVMEIKELIKEELGEIRLNT